VDGDRSEPILGSGAIGSVCVYELELSGFTKDDKRRMRQCVRFAVAKVLDPEESLCRQDPVALREAVEYLEGCEPRLAVCASCWGACALLSRSLAYRRQRLRKRQRWVSTTADVAGDGGAATTDGGREGGGGGVNEGGDVGGNMGADTEAAEQLQYLVQL